MPGLKNFNFLLAERFNERGQCRYNSPFRPLDLIYAANWSMEVNRTSTWAMKRLAMRTPSVYAPLLTFRSMSEMQAAEDSSKLDRMLQIL